MSHIPYEDKVVRCPKRYRYCRRMQCYHMKPHFLEEECSNKRHCPLLPSRKRCREIPVEEAVLAIMKGDT